VQVGLHVISLDDMREIAAYKEDVPLNPASNLKIITAAAALRKLGVDYQFKTKFLSDTPPGDGKITNLYVVGGGDPSVVEERLWRMAKDISLRGVREISGDIIIDQSLFGQAYSDAMGEPYRA
jgi:D-alanyl-D-alanine carboxypeptidase/D-alanyl-D-alanine-endopeptidase (penicillin-binding protein 4)